MRRSEQAVRMDFSLTVPAHSPAAPVVLGFVDGAVLRIAVALAIAAVACIPAIVHMTVTPDGAHYLAIASNLLHGKGFSTGLDMPATSWMPLYPILLAAVMGLLPGSSPVNAAIVLNLLAVAAVFLLAWGLLRTWRGKEDWATWAGAALTALSPGLVRTAELALAETAFTAFVLLLVHAMTRAEANTKWLWVVALASVLVALTRHIGAIVLVAVAIAWFRWSYVPVLLPGVASSTLWLHLCGAGGQLTGFGLARGWRGLLDSLTGALGAAGGIILFGVLVALVWSRRRHRSPFDRAALAGILALLFTALAGFVLVMGDMDGRMQLAAQMLLWLALIGAAAEIPAGHPMRYGAYVGAAACCLLGIARPTPASTSRVDFNSRLWHESKAMKLVRDTPAGIDIYSDAQDGIWFATGRVTYALPRTDGGLKPKPHPDRGGICIWFHVGRSYYRRPGDFRDRALYSRRLGGAFVMELGSAQGEEKEDGLAERPRGYPLTAARRLRPGRAPATSLPDSIDTPAVGHKLVMSAARGFLHRRSK